MKLNLLIVVGLFMLMACNFASTQSEPAVVTSDVNVSDSLVQAWNKAWNTNDSLAIVSLFNQDAVLLGSAAAVNGVDNIASKFIAPNYKVIRNLQTKELASGTTGNTAYFFGTYTHDVALEDKTNVSIAGNFSFVWHKAGNRWSIKVAQIEEWPKGKQ